MDGNNSAKSVDLAVRLGHKRPDPHDGRSAVWLTEDYVDHFKDEANRVRRQPVQSYNIDSGDEWVDEPEEVEGEQMDVCVDQWRNAAPEACKKIFTIFHKSGVFIAVCRHGFLLSICDMVRSCQVWVYSGRGSNQVWMKTDKGQGQGAGQEVSPAGVGDCLDSTTKDNEH